MNICLIFNNLSGNDGRSRVALDLAKLLKQADHQVLEIVGETDKNATEEKAILSNHLCYLANPLKSLFIAWHESKKVAATLDEFRPAVVHFIAESYLLLAPFLIARCRFKFRVILTVHGTYSCPHLSYRGIWKFMYYWLWHFCLKRCAVIIAVSHYTKKHFLSYYPGFDRRTRVVNNGIDLSKIESRAEKSMTAGPPKIIFMGEVKHRKGVAQAIEGFGLYLKKNKSRAIFEIIGRCDEQSDYYRQLRQLIGRWELGDKVIFRGVVSEAEKKKAYQEAKLLLLLSINDGIRFEGFGLVYLEANAYGLPVIGAKNCGAEDAIADGVSGFLVNPHNSEEVAEKIGLILDKKAISVQNCLDWAKKNDFSKRLDQFEEVYKFKANPARFKKILFYSKFLLLCFSRAIFFGFSRQQITDPKSFLVIALAKLGDMVCTTPVFRAIKEKYPDSKLYVVGNQVNQNLLKDNSDVDEYFVFNESNIWPLKKKFERRQIDYAFLTITDTAGAALTILAGIKHIVGLKITEGECPRQTISYKIISLLFEKKIFSFVKYTPREYLRLLEPAGISTTDTTKHLGFSVEAEEKITKFLAEKKIIPGQDLIIGIAPSAGNKLKIWGNKKFAHLADMIYEKYGAKIIILGAGEDCPYAAEMFKNIASQVEAINSCNLFSLDELKCLISKLSVLIGPDTGLIYIAEAFDVATIDILGPTCEFDQPPVGERHKIVTGTIECRPCSFAMSAARSCKNKDNYFGCFKSISSQEVLEELSKLLEIIRPSDKASVLEK